MTVTFSEGRPWAVGTDRDWNYDFLGMLGRLELRFIIGLPARHITKLRKFTLHRRLELQLIELRARLTSTLSTTLSQIRAAIYLAACQHLPAVLLLRRRLELRFIVPRARLIATLCGGRSSLVSVCMAVRRAPYAGRRATSRVLAALADPQGGSAATPGG